MATYISIIVLAAVVLYHMSCRYCTYVVQVLYLSTVCRLRVVRRCAEKSEIERKRRTVIIIDHSLYKMDFSAVTAAKHHHYQQQETQEADSMDWTPQQRSSPPPKRKRPCHRRSHVVLVGRSNEQGLPLFLEDSSCKSVGTLSATAATATQIPLTKTSSTHQRTSAGSVGVGVGDDFVGQPSSTREMNKAR